MRHARHRRNEPSPAPPRAGVASFVSARRNEKADPRSRSARQRPPQGEGLRTTPPSRRQAARRSPGANITRPSETLPTRCFRPSTTRAKPTACPTRIGSHVVCGRGPELALLRRRTRPPRVRAAGRKAPRCRAPHRRRTETRPKAPRRTDPSRTMQRWPGARTMPRARIRGARPPLRGRRPVRERA